MVRFYQRRVTVVLVLVLVLVLGRDRRRGVSQRSSQGPGRLPYRLSTGRPGVTGPGPGGAERCR